MINEYFIYDDVAKEKIFLTFSKKTTYIDAMHITFEDHQNIIMLPVSETIVELDVDDLEAVEQHDPDLYRYYFKDTPDVVSKKYMELASLLKQEDINFDMQEASDSILKFLQSDHNGIHSDSLKAKLCFGNTVIGDLLPKIFGNKLSPEDLRRLDMFETTYNIVWMHGLMMSNLLRKKDIQINMNRVPITTEELAKLKSENTIQ